MQSVAKRNPIAGLAGWLALVYGAATVGAIASLNARSFYAGLVRPEWAPSSAVFAPVWTVLYTLMGIAAWLVWSRKNLQGARAALVLFLVQLALNALWSWLFFAWHLGALAFAEILLLLALIVATSVAFMRIRPLAAALLGPYLLWVAFASALTYSVWQLNPQAL
jgi:tryptophan-rich sensory protein